MPQQEPKMGGVLGASVFWKNILSDYEIQIKPLTFLIPSFIIRGIEKESWHYFSNIVKIKIYEI